MSALAEIARAKEELKTWVARVLAQTFIYTLTAASSALGDKDAVESSDEGRDPGSPASEKKSQRSVVRIQPFGLRSVQPTKLRGLTLRLGMSNLFFIGIGPTKAYGPQNMNVGETALFSSGNAQVLCDKDGNVIVNNGTLKVARVSDGVVVGTLSATVMVAGSPVAAQFIFTPTNADGTPGTPSAPGPTATLAAYIANAGGAAKFKG